MTEPSDADPPGYPHELTELAYLDDGTPVLFRAIRPDDDRRMEALFHRLSPEALYMRFFSPVPRINRPMLQYLVTVDYRDRLALVAVIEDEIVGVARYDRPVAIGPDAGDVDPGEAEVAVIVEDAWQKRGIATRLLWRLSAAAVDRGLHTFTAAVLAENHAMMGLLPVIGEQVETTLADGEYVVKLRLAGATQPGAPAPQDAAERPSSPADHDREPGSRTADD